MSAPRPLREHSPEGCLGPTPGTARRWPEDAPQAVPGVRCRVPLHPGLFLERHYLKPLALNQSDAARKLGVSRRRLHELVHGKRAMSPDSAIRCAQAFGLPAAAWLAMQADWDAWQAWQHLRTQRPAAQG